MRSPRTPYLSQGLARHSSFTDPPPPPRVRWVSVVEEAKYRENLPIDHLQEAKENPRSVEPATDSEQPPAGPWHPALGLSHLPELPKLWSHRDVFGNAVPVHASKFNSLKGAMGGPSDTSYWIIPGLVLAGAYPEGKARRRGRQPTPPSAVGQILAQGVSCFVSVLPSDERSEYERLLGLPPLEAVVEKEHRRMLDLLKAAYVARLCAD